MTDRYSEDQVIAAIAELTRPRLVAFVEARLVVPLQTDRGPVFRQIDMARLALLCDLSDQFGLEEDALAVILSLIDQLHGVRSELRCVLDAVAQEPAEVRARLERAIRRAQSGV
jgi:chaperone modulatory protein CbpM